MRPELENNLAFWEEATAMHGRGNVYGIEDFKAGMCRLHRVEVEEVGDVRGRSLLHLQCHFGIDTLSWARRGAQVTGVDFSPKAIELAQRLSRETGVAGRFLCSDLYELPNLLREPERFDIVFTSYGVLNWLPDLDAWAKIVAHYLRPGGFFYIVEAHPTATIFPLDEEMPRVGSFRPYVSYFYDPAGIAWPPEKDYADPSAMHSVGAHEWHHPLGNIVNALLRQGLRLEWLHEFPFCAWNVVAGCEVVERFSDSHAYYGRPASEPSLPLMFSLRARKPPSGVQAGGNPRD
jgi:SAM-dependent methyltransferase